MRDPGDSHRGSGAPLWTDGDMLFRVAAAGTQQDRMVKVRRPFAIVGRAPDADIVIDDRAASARHAYLHLDPRGVYAVDLVTRTGTRIGGSDQLVGWLRPGDWIEVAGRRIELVRIRIDGNVVDPPPCDAELLADTERPTLTEVTLEPRRPNDSPWVLGSELVFLGWSASCGIQIKDAAVSRTHCALVRAANGAYLVDLCGRQTWVEDRPVHGAAALHDGDLITLGSTQFTVRIEPPARGTAELPEILPRTQVTGYLTPLPNPLAGLPAGFGQLNLPALSPDQVPAEAQGALLAWMIGAIQGGHGELLRRQGEFQMAITQVLRQMQQDNATMLAAHLERIERSDRELAALRAELDRRNSQPPQRKPPDVEPLRIARPPEKDAAAPETRASTTWLLERVNELENENRSAWKDLLGRLTQSRKAT
ncbi:MAG: FHA domain-containing protein [Isosphaeraceae bacterium]